MKFKLEDEVLEKLAAAFDGIATKAAGVRALVSKDRMWKSPDLDSGVYEDARKEGKTVTQRKDDQASVIENRLSVYERETSPLTDYFDRRGVLRSVEGLGTTESVYQSVVAALAS